MTEPWRCCSPDLQTAVRCQSCALLERTEHKWQSWPCMFTVWETRLLWRYYLVRIHKLLLSGASRKNIIYFPRSKVFPCHVSKCCDRIDFSYALISPDPECELITTFSDYLSTFFVCDLRHNLDAWKHGLISFPEKWEGSRTEERTSNLAGPCEYWALSTELLSC